MSASPTSCGKSSASSSRWRAIADELREVVGVVESLAREKNITMSTEVKDVLPSVDADRQRIQQVIYNLLSNAIKFTEPGGFVRVTLDISDGAAAGDKALRIAVADTGIGIKPEDQTRIFEAFEQVDSSYARDQGGTGLGLALTRKLVELHGGTISVASDGVKGRGSVLTVRLPIPRADGD